MKFCWNSAIALFFCIFVLSRVSAGIVWETDLLPDPNIYSSPLASCVNEESSGLYVLTKIVPKGTPVSKEGNCILWEIGEDGRIIRRTLLKDKNKNRIQTNAIPAGHGCAMAADGLGNLLTAGVLGEQRRERSLAVLSRTDRFPADPNMNISPGSRIDHSFIKKMVSLQNNTSVLIGAREGDGFYLQIDDHGQIVQEKTFDLGQTEVFSGAAHVSPNNTCLAVAGSSIGTFEKNSTNYFVSNFLLIYDPNGILLQEDSFEAAYPEMLAALPKVCCLNNSNLVMVFYNKNKKDDKAGLRARCYTREMELLWEKDLLTTDQKFFSFDMVSHNLNGFAVAIPTLEALKFYSFNENGGKTGYSEYKGMVGTFGFNLIRVGGKTVAVFEEGGPGNIEELMIKAKVIAFD